jgi:triphosphoribosyl-dephospho-CoA synthetase
MTALQLKPSVRLPDATTAAIARVAADALLAEVETWPKPGLVSHVDRGSHDDMDADTFRRSVAATGPRCPNCAVSAWTLSAPCWLRLGA